MLRRLGNEQHAADVYLSIGEASFPAPFQSKLEFNPPVHGTWNIVHTGMLIPDAPQIYICSANCMRGVVLTAAEMNAPDRFSQVLIEEKDVLAGSIEQLTVDGVLDVLSKLPKRPKAVLVFTVCVHHFLGSDLDWIYRELRRQAPDVIFVRCFMDPIMKKSGLTPDEKMRRSLYEPISPLPVNPRTVALLGSDFATDEDGDLRTYLEENGYRLLELPAAEDFEEYLQTGEAALLIACYPAAKPGAKALADQLGRPFLYLPLTFDADEIVRNEERLAETLQRLKESKPVQQTTVLRPRSLTQQRAQAEKALAQLRDLVGDTPIAIDYTLHPRPLGLAKLLLDHDFTVDRVYLDAVSGEEEPVFEQLQAQYPQLKLYPTVHPSGRLQHGDAPQMLALGQKAAWFTGSRHFVNVVEGAGWYGFNGIEKLCAAVSDAFDTEKDPVDCLPRKGLGCESCF